MPRWFRTLIAAPLVALTIASGVVMSAAPASALPPVTGYCTDGAIHISPSGSVYECQNGVWVFTGVLA
jgi:hypothetical protein